MPFADADLVDGQALEPAQWDMLEAFFEVSFLNGFDQIPAHAQMLSDSLDAHVSAQVQDVALEGLGIMKPAFGKAKLGLSRLRPHASDGAGLRRGPFPLYESF